MHYFCFSVHDPGLYHILCHYGSSRQEVYKRMFGILVHGAKVVSQKSDGKFPTLVYLLEIRQAIRQRFDAEAESNLDEFYDNNPGFHAVSWPEIKSFQWPNPPKACKICSQKFQNKPY